MNKMLQTSVKSIDRFLKELTTPKNPISNNQGFSLIEILVALTLLGIAGTFVAGKIFDQLEAGKRDAAKSQIAILKGAVQDFRRRCGFYPSSEDGLMALVQAPTSRECRNYPPEGFLEDGVVPLDPWEYDFVYKSDGKSFEIISGSSDNEIGTEDDISSKRKQRKGKGH